MAVGKKIKRIRKFRGMTQKELGVAVGFPENNADIRIAQYESNTRTPKEDILRALAQALRVSYPIFSEPSELYCMEDVISMLFEMDEHYGLHLHEVQDEEDAWIKHIAISFNSHFINDIFKEWLYRKQELKEGKISKEEYFEWKINWPYTSDGCGSDGCPKYEPTVKWRIQK